MISRKRDRSWMRRQFGSPMGRIIKRRRITARARSAANNILQAPMVNRIVRKLKKQVELKEINTSISGTFVVANSGTWQTTSRILLNGLAQGNTKLTRIGDKINMVDLLLRFSILRHTTDGHGIAARIVVLFDRSPVGAVPAPTDVFLTNGFYAPLNRTNAGRFSILHDEYVDLNVDEFISTHKLYLDLKRVGVVNYGLGNAGTVADISHGSLWLWINCNLVDTADSTLTGNARVKYRDN